MVQQASAKKMIIHNKKLLEKALLLRKISNSKRNISFYFLTWIRIHFFPVRTQYQDPRQN